VVREPDHSAFFADVEQVWEQLPERQRRVVAQVRTMLARLDLPYARPESTRATFHEDDGAVWLHIKHASDSPKLGLGVLHDHVVLHWPGGVYEHPEWGSIVADTLESLLTGRNVERMQRHFRTVVAVDTEVWLDGKIRRALPRLTPPGHRRRLLRLLPWEPQLIEVSISFDRPNALAPPAKEDRT
jgi:hypothetical protein